MSKRIYLSPPFLSGDEMALLENAVASNWIAPLGPHVDAFEQEISHLVAGRPCVALSSGTAAVHLALILSDVQPGDTVLCSTLTFVGSANPIVYSGAQPFFVDCEAKSWNLDPDRLNEAVKTCSFHGIHPKAVVVTDVMGQCADYEPIRKICATEGIQLIEDAAEALGASYRGAPAGSLGDRGILSFNGNKIITTSGGGMLIAKDEKEAQRARFLATQARDEAPHYEHSEVGYNYRLSNLLAAVGRGQLRSLKDRVAKRRYNFEFYRKLLEGTPGIEFMPEADFGRTTRWLTCLTIDPERFGSTANHVRKALEAQNIEARPIWKPMHLQPVFNGCQVAGGTVAEQLFARGLCLPSGNELEDSDLERIADIIRRASPH